MQLDILENCEMVASAPSKTLLKNNRSGEDFLLEIGTEELPPRELDHLAQNLLNLLITNLEEVGLPFNQTKVFYTPRRIAVLINNLASKQQPQKITRKGPPVTISFDQKGKPTIAALKFAESCGVTVAALERIEDKKGEFLFYQETQPGAKTSDLLPEIISNSIKKLPVKRAMHWGDNQGPFIRPIHWVVALLGNKTLNLEIFGIKASNQTFGHRFHHPDPLIITEPNQYEKILAKKGFVIVDPNQRKQIIVEQTASLTKDEQALIPNNLLLEVTNLVEWPVILMGRFNERFLKIPSEILTTTLEKHQRCFPIADEAGELLPRFIIIANIESKLPSQLIAGNEKVIHARFSDAEYFYQQDLKTKLEDNLPKLKNISFQEQLGSLYDKTLRLKQTAPMIAEKIGGDVGKTERAAELAKCDLVTNMVWEFPELQGTIGYYYAQKTENKKIALSLKEQYLPRFAKDQTSDTKIGISLALADRLDLLVGFFAINKIPTGDKDPFGLRRAATGIIRTILENNLDVDLKELLELASSTYKKLIKNKEELSAKILDFIYDRLRASYTEQGKNITVFQAALASTPANLLDFTKRFNAINKFITLSEADDLIEIYKRIHNILNKVELPKKPKINPKLILEKSEKTLLDISDKKTKKILELYQQQKYDNLLLELITLKQPLSDFFDQVMVMDENKKIRENRLALLKSIKDLFGLTADLSCLVSGKK